MSNTTTCNSSKSSVSTNTNSTSNTITTTPTRTTKDTSTTNTLNIALQYADGTHCYCYWFYSHCHKCLHELPQGLRVTLPTAFGTGLIYIYIYLHIRNTILSQRKYCFLVLFLIDGWPPNISKDLGMDLRMQRTKNEHTCINCAHEHYTDKYWKRGSSRSDRADAA